MASIEITKDAKGQFRFRVKANNGEIVAVSESYKVKPKALAGINSLKSALKTAKVVDLTVAAPAAKKGAKKAAKPAKKAKLAPKMAAKPFAKPIAKVAAKPVMKKPAAPKPASPKPAPAFTPAPLAESSLTTSVPAEAAGSN